jgi:hypothetical protein
MTRRNLTGLSIAVIGGGSGIGRETALLLARSGARVGVGDRAADAASAVAAEISPTTFSAPVDVTDPASLAAFRDAAEGALGPLDAVVCSAGIMWVGPFEEETDAQAQAQIAVNLLGVIHTTRAFAPAMRARRRGHLLVLASAASFLPTPGEATYAASKHGVLGYLKAVRTELRGSGVHISAIMPTVVATPLAAGTSTGSAKMLQPSDVAEMVARTIRRPRFEVLMPWYLGPARKLVDLLPQALKDRVMLALVPDQVRSVDRGARESYEKASFDAA